MDSATKCLAGQWEILNTTGSNTDGTCCTSGSVCLWQRGSGSGVDIDMCLCVNDDLDNIVSV